MEKRGEVQENQVDQVVAEVEEEVVIKVVEKEVVKVVEVEVVEDGAQVDRGVEEDQVTQEIVLLIE